ncbi:hypothetical protein R3P38DRAFT_2665522 [Favolaschia claudopus]|uniref:Uncharacterized protein n=1 Tax=Favolaschia claudopus TaxID=2862362 RepID=A0AAV9ZCP5_9AGAR
MALPIVPHTSCLLPRAPLELERRIFEIAATQNGGDIPRFMRTAWRVREWTEPLLYRILFFRLTPTVPFGPVVVPIEDRHWLPYIPFPAFLTLLSVKPTSFFERHVRHIFIDAGIEAYSLVLYIVILTACSHITDLYILHPPTPDYIPIICRLHSLRRLAIQAVPLFAPNQVNFGSALFRNITHLQLLDFDDYLPQHLGEQLALAPCLTHVSFSVFFNVPALHTRVRTNTQLQCIVFLDAGWPSVDLAAPLEIPDDRVVVIRHTNFFTEFFRGSRNGDDYWGLAEAFIHAKRQGEVDGSLYVISTRSNPWRGRSVGVRNE